jgi:tRNA (cmo5U34)-methyltransferase
MNTKTGSWQFDAAVANSFVEHARQHIPNYDLVIDKCVAMAENSLGRFGRIIDVGCATGETLRRLRQAGFLNLTGVEASEAMLNHCDHDIARYIHSDCFPQEQFDAIICNWTLHFVSDKKKYLSDISKSLSTRGFLILSEKTSLDPTAIKFYHQWKHSQGVSWSDIRAKEEAVKGIMYIDSPAWYTDTLQQVGFNNIQIIDASWCFTTFLCTK